MILKPIIGPSWRILSAYVRTNAPITVDEQGLPIKPVSMGSTDIEAVLTVFSRRRRVRDAGLIDLSYVDLRHVTLGNLHLGSVSLVSAYLENVSMINAGLEGINAGLEGALLL